MAISITSFSPNTTILSSAVNTNFANLKTAIENTETGHVHDGVDSKLISVNRAFVWYVSGTLTSSATAYGARYVVPQSMTIVKCWLIVKTAPVGQAILVDIHKNGTTIWTTQGNRATIVASATAGNTTTFDVNN